MLPIMFLLFSMFVSLLALSAPTALDASVLLQNGQTAQQLNAQFNNLQATDACSTGDTGCISGLSAQCSNGTWQTQKCPGGSRQCFALPSVRSNGTFIACTSKANALSLIDATGAQGGLALNTTSNGTDPSISSGSVNSTTPSVSPGEASTFTLSPTTRTIDPAQASALVSQLAGGDIGSFVPTTCTSMPTSAPSLSPSLLVNSSSNTPDPNPAVASPIQLTGSLLSTPTSTPAAASVD